MNNDFDIEVSRDLVIKADLLPERFTIVGAFRKRDNDYIVIGQENGDTYCSWLYNPNCGFIYGHYRLTLGEALKDLVERG